MLRLNLQSSFDSDIAEIIQRYKETYFNHAMANLRENIKDQSVTDSDVSKRITVIFPYLLNIPFHCS